MSTLRIRPVVWRLYAMFILRQLYATCFCMLEKKRWKVGIKDEDREVIIWITRKAWIAYVMSFPLLCIRLGVLI